MPRIFCLFIAIMLIFSASAQRNSSQLGCKDADLLVQANEQKQSLLAQGFEVVNDGMLTMFSRQDFPIVVRLQAGVFYQMLFVGNTRSKKMKLSLFSPSNELQIEKEQEPLNQTSNVISFSFSPATSGNYTIMLSQNMKQELLKFKSSTSICGSFSILRVKKKD